jgi:hypothetical protein
MSDSRITVALDEARAAVELLRNARRTLNTLIDEDPRFSEVVEHAMQEGARELFLSTANATTALRHMQRADAAENNLKAS